MEQGASSIVRRPAETSCKAGFIARLLYKSPHDGVGHHREGIQGVCRAMQPALQDVSTGLPTVGGGGAEVGFCEPQTSLKKKRALVPKHCSPRSRVYSHFA